MDVQSNVTTPSAVFHCQRCEYELTGVPDDCRCPECGESLRWNRQVFTKLLEARRKKVSQGAIAIIVFNIPVLFLALGLAFSVGITVSLTAFQLRISDNSMKLIAAALILTELGAFPSYRLFTAAQGAVFGHSWRRMVIWAMRVQLALLVMMVLVLAAALQAPVKGKVIAWIPLAILISYSLAWFMRVLANIMYISEIAQSMRDKRTVEVCRKLIWQLPLLHVIGLLVPIATAVGLALYIKLLWRIRGVVRGPVATA